jgi:hypothetical protein
MALAGDESVLISLDKRTPEGLPMADGSGDLHVSSLHGVLRSGILPLTDLRSIEVVDGRGTVLLVAHL